MIQEIILNIKVYFKANDIDQLSMDLKGSMNKNQYRNHLIKHLNQSLFASSSFGRLVSYIKAFIDKNVDDFFDIKDYLNKNKNI